MKEQIEKIIEEFTKQAENFNVYQQSLSKEEHSRLSVQNMALSPGDTVLEVAAGTCAFGRHIAPLVRRIVELDATEAMLEVGRIEGEKAGIANAVYTVGLAEALPFPDGSFDAVVSRLAFHHFARADGPFREMCRVLKDGGKLAVIDMAAREEPLRDAADAWETLRDPSHVRCLSETEFRRLAEENHMEITLVETNRISVYLEDWMALTKVPEDTGAKIRAAMAAELAGGPKTGFAPYEREGRVLFDHQWLQIIAIKKGK